ncbi:hypothetical protein M5K25_026733 [Dendrobium thyrsiflorum]|uniref:Uncharacterized protein n=1 Tax=Dendrobium thyrsiflorum TaxID=117978 RepID=A0ABD0TY47_DENTH
MPFVANPLALSVPEPAFEAWLRDSGYLETLDTSSSSLPTSSASFPSSSSKPLPPKNPAAAVAGVISPVFFFLRTLASLFTINPFAKLTPEDFAGETPSWTLRYQMPILLLSLMESLGVWELLRFCSDKWELEEKHPAVRTILVCAAQFVEKRPSLSLKMALKWVSDATAPNPRKVLKSIERKMELQNTPFTVQLGRGASIQLANAVINAGDSEATIGFGSLEFPVATAMTATVPIHSITVQGCTARLDSAETYARRAYSVQQPQATRTATAKAVQQNRASVFERLSHPEVSSVKRTDIKQKTLPILSSVITLPTEPFVPGRHDHEASSYGGRLSRRQRRKLNAELRARQPLPVHLSTLPALEPEANVPSQNKFANLNWVKRNSSIGELK